MDHYVSRPSVLSSSRPHNRITPFLCRLASILLSRLLLDLHEVNSAENETGSRATRPTLDTIAFTTVSLADNEEVF